VESQSAGRLYWGHELEANPPYIFAIVATCALAALLTIGGQLAYSPC
jgi:hypothetical protein